MLTRRMHDVVAIMDTGLTARLVEFLGRYYSGMRDVTVHVVRVES